METSAAPPPESQTPTKEASEMNNGPDGAASDTAAKRKRQPRNSACQSCAGLKMKCIASQVVGICERCNRMSRECLPSIPKPRKRQSINGLSEPELRGLPLSHILDNNQPSYPVSNHSPTPAVAVEDRTSDAFRDSLLSKPDVTQSGSRSFIALFAHGLGFDENARSSHDLLTGVDYAFVYESFAIFERMAARSPFIELPSTDVVKMVAKRPVTCLSICIVAIAANTELRMRLVRTFRQAISTKCIVESEQSIDLMSGLLIHLTWHHRYLYKQQVYQLLHLLTSMATEHGLYRNPGPDVYGAQQPDRETQLLFLGCYYLCTSLSGLGSDRPSPFHWSDHLHDIARRSSPRGPFSNSNDTIPFIELARHLEETDTTLREAAEPLDSPSHNQTWSTWHNAETSLRSLKTLTDRHPSLATHSDVQATRITLSALVLQNSKTIQTSRLTAAALHIKDYFETLLAEPPASLFYTSIIAWTNLLSVLATLVLILHPRFEAWEAVPGALHSLLEPEALLDTLAARMSTAGPLERHDELLAWFSALVGRIKAKLQRDRAVSARSSSRGGSGDLSGTEARFRPVNVNVGAVGQGFGGEGMGGGRVGSVSVSVDGMGTRRGSGFCDVEIGRVCKLDFMEDGFWDRFLMG